MDRRDRNLGGNEMNHVYLCIGNYASTPFYLERACLSIYSIEELCYYICENIHLLDNSFPNLDLVAWIEEECKLPEIANALYPYCCKKKNMPEFVNCLLSKTFYCSEGQRKEYIELITESLNANLLEKRKAGADYLVRKGKYTLALAEYESILLELDKEQTILMATILHNIGSIYSFLFYFDKAAEYYWCAYETSHSIEEYISFLSAKRLELSESEYIEFISTNQKHYQVSMEVEKRLEKKLQHWEDSDEKAQLEETRAYKNSNLSME